MENKDIFKLIGLCLLILFAGFEIGMFCSKSLVSIQQTNYFNNMTIPNNYTLNWNINNCDNEELKNESTAKTLH